MLPERVGRLGLWWMDSPGLEVGMCMHEEVRALKPSNHIHSWLCLPAPTINIHILRTYACRYRRPLLALPCKYRVVFFPVVVGVEKLLEPLEELKIVLELALHQPLHWDDLRTKDGGSGVRCWPEPEVSVNFTYRTWILTRCVFVCVCVLTLSTFILLNAACRTLKLWMYSCSSFELNLIFFINRQPGNSMSMNWQ